jgi:hypothetical protein
MNKQNRKYLWLLPGLMLALFCACFLIAGTWVITFEVDDQDIHASESFYKFSVNLNDNSDWNDNKDKLDNIEDVVFTFWLKNRSSNTMTGQVYVSDDSTLSSISAVQSSATLILDNISVPANDSLYVDMAHYYDLLQNFDALRDIVKPGVFTAYGIVPNPLQGDLYDAVVIVTVSAGP